MKTRFVPFQVIAFLALLGTGGVTYAVLSVENDRREEKRERIAFLQEIRKSRSETAFEGECTIDTILQGTRYTTRMEIHREGEERRIRLLDSQGGKRTRTSSKMGFFGGIPGLFQPGKFRRSRLQDPARIAGNYHVTIREGETVAGRPGRRIRLEPKTNDRPAYEFVADERTSFPLRFSVYGKEGKLFFQKRFDSIRFLPGSFHGKRRPKRFQKSTWMKISHEEISLDSRTRFGFPIWIPAHLPAGFARTGAMRVKIKTTLPERLSKFRMNLEMVHLVYSDGIALFSLVQFSPDNPAWRMMKSLFPGTGPGTGGGVSTRKLSLGIGSAFILELDGTVVILAGNLWDKPLRETAESLTLLSGEKP